VSLSSNQTDGRAWPTGGSYGTSAIQTPHYHIETKVQESVRPLYVSSAAPCSHNWDRRHHVRGHLGDVLSMRCNLPNDTLVRKFPVFPLSTQRLAVHGGHLLCKHRNHNVHKDQRGSYSNSEFIHVKRGVFRPTCNSPNVRLDFVPVRLPPQYLSHHSVLHRRSGKAQEPNQFVWYLRAYSNDAYLLDCNPADPI